MRICLFIGSVWFMGCSGEIDITNSPVFPPSFAPQDYWKSQTAYPGIGAGRVLITNNYSDSVSILDYSQLAKPGLTVMAEVLVGVGRGHTGCMGRVLRMGMP